MTLNPILVPMEDQLHIVICSTGIVDCPPIVGGGVEAYVWDISNILSHTNHTVTLVTNIRRGTSATNGVKIERSGSPIDRFPLTPLQSSVAHMVAGTFTSVATQRVLSASGHNPTVLHLNEEVSSMILCHRYPDVPKVFTLHNPPLEGYIRPFGLIERIMRRSNTAISRRFIWNKADIVIALSDWIRRFLVLNGVPEERVLHLSLPIDTNTYQPDHTNRYDSVPYLLYVGRLDTRKNVTRLVSAIARIRRRVRLVLVGRGPAEVQIADFIGRNGLSDSVSILGRVPFSVLLRLYQGASALCLPSILEAYPRVVLEAAACGVPSILPQSFLYTDFINRGFVVTYDPADTLGLENAIERFIDDLRLQRLLAGLARKYALEVASYPMFIRALERAYTAALQLHVSR